MESNKDKTEIGNLVPPRKSATIDALLKVNKASIVGIEQVHGNAFPVLCVVPASLKINWLS